jgi:secreted Zn-dependent insulinase-like peptidase
MNTSITSELKKFYHNGFAMLRYLYTRKELNQIKTSIDHYFKNNPEKESYAIRHMFVEMPDLKSVVLNTNLLSILKKLHPDLRLCKAIFFDKTPDSNWYVT